MAEQMAEPTVAAAVDAAPRRRAELRDGALATVPLWLGAVPFAIIYAASAVAAGLTPAQTIAMSLLVFAGAAQFTAVGMVAAGAAPAAIVLTTLIVNARHLLLAASLLPYLRRVRPWRRLLLAAQLTDETYALAVRRFLDGDGSPAFMAGANLMLYIVWQAGTVAGVLLGAAIPDPAAYGLDLVFPLTFVGLLVPLLRDRASRPVAAVAALLTVVGALLLPGSWYIVLAGVGASLLGRTRVAERGQA
jgi:4-azaleucine resistance transporter AzlC